jgi:hypothetical protein
LCVVSAIIFQQQAFTNYTDFVFVFAFFSQLPTGSFFVAKKEALVFARAS